MDVLVPSALVQAACLQDDVQAIKVAEGSAVSVIETVAVEEEVKVFINGILRVTSSMSPCDLEDYAYGAAFGLGCIDEVGDIEQVSFSNNEGQHEVHLLVREGESGDVPAKRGGDTPKEVSPSSNPGDVPAKRASKLGDVPSGASPISNHTSFSAPQHLRPEAIYRMNEALLQAQPLYRVTGATHAAAFVDFEGQASCIREDVGRHNAIDKLIGALLRAGKHPAGGFLYLSSRCALELVMKCARFGFRIIVTVSAPTSAVLKYAEEEDITICAFSRGSRFTIYSHPERIDL